MDTSLVQFYHHIYVVRMDSELYYDDVECVRNPLSNVSISFLSIYSCYAAEILLEILMPLHYGCAFRWPLATLIKWFA